MNIFERAARCKLRFESTVGELSTEQLWDLPLTAKGDRVDLDKLARAVHTELKGLDEVSFVDDSKTNPRKISLELRLDILKHIIESKKASKLAAEKAVETSKQKDRLLAALASKDDQKLASMTTEEIQAELAKLG